MESDDSNKTSNCLSCKIISIACLTSIGLYLIHTGRSQKSGAKYLTFILGTGSLGLSVGELFDKSPFRSYGDDSENTTAPNKTHQ